MTTSSDHQNPTTPKPNQWAGGEHWFELTATLSDESRMELDKWIDAELAYLEDDLERFVTPNSLRNSLRR